MQLRLQLQLRITLQIKLPMGIPMEVPFLLAVFAEQAEHVLSVLSCAGKKMPRCFVFYSGDSHPPAADEFLLKRFPPPG